MHSKTEISVREIMDLHRSNMPYKSYTVTLEETGTTSQIRCKPVNALGGNTPSVTLLTEDSTPSKHALQENAQKQFDDALRNLIEKGIRFYTILHPKWTYHEMLWEKG